MMSSQVILFLSLHLACRVAAACSKARLLRRERASHCQHLLVSSCVCNAFCVCSLASFRLSAFSRCHESTKKSASAGLRTSCCPSPSLLLFVDWRHDSSVRLFCTRYPSSSYPAAFLSLHPEKGMNVSQYLHRSFEIRTRDGQ
jgi:hypothetical protein